MTRFDPDAKVDPDAHPDVNDHGDLITPLEAGISHKDTRKLHAKAEEGEREWNHHRDQALEELERQAAKRREPIRMDGLQPLPPAQIGIQVPKGHLPGGPDALSMTPSIRRSIPAPYQRPSIQAGRHGKTWGYLRADQVEIGDIIVDFGRVDSLATRGIREKVAGHDVLVGEKTVFMNPLGKVEDFDPDAQLRVFRVHAEDGGDDA